MNTTENNKLIAEFMEFPFLTEEGQTNFIIDLTHVPDYELEFHSDWNWLMEVVEKIQQSDRYIYIKIDTYCTFISILQYKQIEVRKGNMLESTYHACVEFIKWYNQQKR